MSPIFKGKIYAQFMTQFVIILMINDVAESNQSFFV